MFVTMFVPSVAADELALAGATSAKKFTTRERTSFDR